MSKVVLGIGSNINREENILSGIEELRAFINDLKVSSVYESPAFGFHGNNFYNLVVSGKCDMSLKSLTSLLRDIEYAHGRPENAEKFSSRQLDIDVLLYDDKVGVFSGLQLPRPEILEQAYVLKPLAELEPALLHPQSNENFERLWISFGGESDLWLADFQLVEENNTTASA